VRRAVAGFAVFFALAQPAGAHRFHVSIAEAEFNDSSQRLEVAQNVSLLDVEEALSPETDREERLAGYVAERWNFVSADGTVRKPVWVGHEVEGDHLWLYFEVPLPGGLDGARVENRMFFELDSRQVNTVNFREGDWRFSAAYRHGERVREFSRSVE
jgi:hypothetical protein